MGNETWIVETGAQVIEKKVQDGITIFKSQYPRATPSVQLSRLQWFIARILFAGLTVLSVALCQVAYASTAADAFKQLSSLAGEWEGKSSNGRPYTVSYRLIAGGSALVEDWHLAPGREAMTVYHLDGDTLTATHYCPQGNQPRLQLVIEKDSDKFSFQFHDGTNLQDPQKYHQHFFWIKLLGPDTFERSETYVKNNSTQSEIEATTRGQPVKYTRLKPPPESH